MKLDWQWIKIILEYCFIPAILWLFRKAFAGVVIEAFQKVEHIADAKALNRANEVRRDMEIGFKQVNDKLDDLSETVGNHVADDRENFAYFKAKLGLVVIALLFAGFARGQNAFPMPSAVYQFLDNNGAPLAGGLLYTCVAGLSCPGNPQATYTDSTGSVPNPNPIVLDSAGRAQIWLGSNPYRLALHNSSDIPIWTQDNVTSFTSVNQIVYLNPAPGAVLRTLTSRLSDIWSLKDFGAACDGSTDDTAALNSATAAAGGNIRTIAIPYGTCVLLSSVSVPNNITLWFVGGQLAPANTRTLTINGTVLAADDTPIFAGLGSISFSSLRTVSSRWFQQSDCGANINAAYFSLPPTGGIVKTSGDCSFTTNIVFGTNNKPAILQGTGADSNILTFTGTGTAITLNYGGVRTMAGGVRDITLTGPGNGTGTFGIVIGSTNGAPGFLVRDFKIQSFGTNVQLASNATLGTFINGTIRDGGTNLLIPNGANAGELQFNHVTFADAPSPHANSVWIQTSSALVTFTDCMFLQAQLRIGTGGGGTQSTVSVKGSHFENPNFMTGADYHFVQMDNNALNSLEFTDNFILQDRGTGGNYSALIELDGGKASIFGLTAYSNITVQQALVLANGVNLDFYGFNGNSANFNALFGGSTTGNIQTANNLYNTAGALVFSPAPHTVVGTATLSTGSATVTLTGRSVFTSAGSFFCGVADVSGPNPVQLAASSGSSFTLTGTGSDSVTFICSGN